MVIMKYTKEIEDQLTQMYQAEVPVEEIAAKLEVPVRSVIAKLSSLGVYKKKQYLTKQGTTPVKKDEYIDRIAALMQVNSELLESLEKANKNVLQMLEKALAAAKE